MAISKGSLSQMLHAFEDKLEDLQGNDIESSTDILGTMYEDLDGSVLGEIGSQASYEELKSLYERLHDDDPIVNQYDTFEDWLDDTESSGYLRKIGSSFDYPDDLEDLENGEYESHMTEPVKGSIAAAPEFDMLDKSTIQASDEDEFNEWLWAFERELESEIIGRHNCVDYVEFDELDDGLSMTVAFNTPDGEFNLNDYDIPFDDLTQDDELLSDDVDMVADTVDIDLDEFDVDDDE